MDGVVSAAAVCDSDDVSACRLDDSPATSTHQCTLNYQYVTTSPSEGVLSIEMCMYVHLHNSKTARPNFTNFLCMMPAAVAQ